MIFSAPITGIIESRFSCRRYARQEIPEDKRLALRQAAEGMRAGPLGSPLRFGLLAAAADDETALRGLGTYGFIRDPAGFIVGAVKPGGAWLEDYGYALEELVLVATDLGLGSCWLGGSFTRGSFSRRIDLAEGESVPAVICLGVIGDPDAARAGTLRRAVGGDRRRPWEDLFFDGTVGVPLSREAAGPFAAALDMVRLAPSASNKQPWRIVRAAGAWQFLLARTPGYGGGVAGKLLGIADMQRVDMGIAMCHFELSARELGLPGRWRRDPTPPETGGRAEYTVSWEC